MEFSKNDIPASEQNIIAVWKDVYAKLIMFQQAESHQKIKALSEMMLEIADAIVEKDVPPAIDDFLKVLLMSQTILTTKLSVSPVELNLIISNLNDIKNSGSSLLSKQLDVDDVAEMNLTKDNCSVKVDPISRHAKEKTLPPSVSNSLKEEEIVSEQNQLLEPTKVEDFSQLLRNLFRDANSALESGDFQSFEKLDIKIWTICNSNQALLSEDLIQYLLQELAKQQEQIRIAVMTEESTTFSIGLLKKSIVIYEFMFSLNPNAPYELKKDYLSRLIALAQRQLKRENYKEFDETFNKIYEGLNDSKWPSHMQISLLEEVIPMIAIAAKERFDELASDEETDKDECDDTKQDSLDTCIKVMEKAYNLLKYFARDHKNNYSESMLNVYEDYASMLVSIAHQANAKQDYQSAHYLLKKARTVIYEVEDKDSQSDLVQDINLGLQKIETKLSAIREENTKKRKAFFEAKTSQTREDESLKTEVKENDKEKKNNKKQKKVQSDITNNRKLP